jgi:hypothetical protein
MTTLYPPEFTVGAQMMLTVPVKSGDTLQVNVIVVRRGFEDLARWMGESMKLRNPDGSVVEGDAGAIIDGALPIVDCRMTEASQRLAEVLRGTGADGPFEHVLLIAPHSMLAALHVPELWQSALAT